MMKKLMFFSMLTVLLLSLWFHEEPERAPKGGKVLTTVTAAKLKSLDPVQAESYYDAVEVGKVYEGLLEYHYLKRPSELIPNLATEMPTVSTDGCVYTFTIKQGVKFHDNACFPEGKGRELVAEDFVYSIKRAADPKCQSPWYSMLAEKIKGLDAWRAQQAEAGQTDYAAEVAGLKALDKETLQFTLTQPWPQFLYILAMNFCDVVPQEAVHHYGKAFMNHPVGTGPFTLKEFKPEFNRLIYHKNPTFRDKFFPTEAAEEYQHLLADAGKKLPFVDAVVTQVIVEEQPRWLKFKLGQVDLIDLSRDSTALEVIQEGALTDELKKKGMQLFLEAEMSTGFFAFNNGHALFKDNMKLRQALAMAFDAERYNALFHNNTAVLAQGIIPPGLAGYQKDYKNPYKAYDLEKAKQLLAEAGYPKGKGLPVITLDTPSNTKRRQECEFFQKCMEGIGVKVKVVGNTMPELMRKVAQRETMMHAFSWGADYPDADDFLSLVYKADQNVGIGLNFSHPAFNGLYEKAMAMDPSPERTVLYEQLNRMAEEQMLAIYTVHQVRPLLYQGWVKNYCWSGFAKGSEAYLDIDLEQKKTLLGR